MEPPQQDQDVQPMVALLENQAKEVWDEALPCRGRCDQPSSQVGLAMLDLSSMRLTLVQIIEPSSTYTHVLVLLAAVQPEHLLVVDSAQASYSGLNTATRAIYTHVPVPRAFFDDTKVLQHNFARCSHLRLGPQPTRSIRQQPTRTQPLAAAAHAHCPLPSCWRCRRSAEARIP